MKHGLFNLVAFLIMLAVKVYPFYASLAASKSIDLSEHLLKEFGKGFSVDNLENMRRFISRIQ